MSNNTDSETATLNLLGRHLALTVVPLKKAVSDLESFRSFMYRLGWNVGSLPQSYVDLGNLVDNVSNKLENLPESPSLSEVQDLLDVIKKLYVAIKEIDEAPQGVDPDSFLSEIGERIFELLMIDYLSSNVPELYTLLISAGIIEFEHHEEFADRPAFLRSRIRTDVISKLISDPSSILRLVYNWGTDQFNFRLFADYLREFCVSLDIPASIHEVRKDVAFGYQGEIEQIKEPIERMVNIPIFDTDIDGIATEVGISILELPAEDDKLPGFIIQPMIPNLGNEYKISDEMTLRIEPGTDLSSPFGILVRVDDISLKYPFKTDPLPAESSFGLTLEYKPLNPITILGSASSSRLQIGGGTASLKGKFGSKNSFQVELIGKDLLLVLVLEEGSLLSKLFGKGDLNVPIPLTIEWSNTSGFRVNGGTAFRVSYNPHLNIGRAKIDKLTLEIISGNRVSPDPNFATEILLGISGSIGPVTFSADGIGLQFKLVFKDGNAGPFDIGFDVVPPQGIGLAINGNGVKGGGFIARTENQYSGVIDLELLKYSVQALAIVRTDPVVSILFAIFAQFKKAIQLGAGWKITKIGGMLGINHTVSHDKIATGIKSGILDKIMFPDNIIRDAPVVISNYETVFPLLHGQNIFGPAIQIAYGTPTLITADVAVILEFPNPFLLSILGKVTCKLPNKDKPIVQINVGIVGALDIVNGKVGVYGSIYDSKILNFALSGDMAMVASWGTEKNFIFSIGGFHPRFNPPSNFPPFNAPPLKRLNLAFSSNVSFECYLALTSNTFQIGARVTALFSKSGATISGFVSFDALVQFNPLYYVVDIEAGFSVKYKGASLAVMFYGFIEGPNPHRIKGSLKFSIFWWDISISVEKTFGDQKAELIAEVDPGPILMEALGQEESWIAETPTWANIGVITKEHPSVQGVGADGGASGNQMVHPFGMFKVSQKVVPLNYTLTKFGTANPKKYFRFEINSVSGSRSASIKDYFAPAQFTEYDNSKKLTLKSYELFYSGVSFVSSEQEVLFSKESLSHKEITYETRVLEDVSNLSKKPDTPPRKDPFRLNAKLVQTLILAGAAYHSSVSNSNKSKYELMHHAKEVTLEEEKFIIVDEDGNEVMTGDDQMSQSLAINKLKFDKKLNPQGKRNLNVVSLFERGEVVVA